MTIFSTIFNAVSPVSSSILKPVAIGGAVIVVVGGFYAYAQERQKTADDAKYQAIIYQQEIINAKKEGVLHCYRFVSCFDGRWYGFGGTR